MGYITQTKDYWIAPNAVNITLNALGEANRIQGSVASGAVIMCWVDGIAELGYDNGHEYRRWPLSLSPTYFNTETAKYVYAAVPRSTSIGTQAVIVFPSEQLDINGKNASEQQIGSTDYLYIYLHGIISEVLTENNSTFRRWTLDPKENWGQLDTAAARDAQKNTSDWFHYDQATQLVTFLKGIVMSATSWFQNIRLGNKNLTGVATATTGDEYIDSDELVATPSYINSKYLSKTHEDTAEAKITFQDGLNAKNVRVTGSNGTTPDTDNQTMKEVGLDVAYSTVIGGVLRVAKSVLTKTIQSLNFSGSDSLTGTGWQLTDDDGNGRSRLIVDDAVFRGKVSLNQLEVRKLTAMGGNYVFSPAAGIIEEVDYYGYKIVPGEVEPAVELLGYEYIKVPWVLRLIPLSLRGRYLSRKKWVRSTMTAEDFERVKFYRCWLKADDGSTQTINTWQVGMLARCQTFDTSQIENGNHAGSYDKPQDSGGTYSNVTNKLYWRAVVAKGEGIDKEHYQGDTIALDDGRKHNYIDLANYVDNGVQLFFNGSDHVNAGDHIVCFGDWKDRQLANLVTIETIGNDAPAVKEFVGVGYTDDTGTAIDWSLDGKVLTRISPISGNKFVAPHFSVIINGQTHDLANFMVNTDGVLTEVQGGMTGMMSVVKQTAGGYAVYLRKLGTEESDILAGFTLDSNGNIDITGSKITLGTGSSASQQAVFEGGKLRLALLDVAQIVAGGISAQTIDCNNATFKNVNVSGEVTATSGKIAGFTIEGGVLKGSSKSMSNYSLELGPEMMEFEKTDNLTGYTVTTTLNSDGLEIWDGKHRFKTFEAAGANSILTAAGYPDMYNTRLPLTLANTDTNSNKTNVALRLSAHSGGKNVAVMIDNGQVMGLRPEVRGVNRDTALTLYDHTIIATSGCTLTLPSSPQEGQQYHIVCMTTGTVKLKSVAQSAEQSAAQINWKYRSSSSPTEVWQLGKGTEYDLTASVREAWLTFTGKEWHLTNN